MPLPPQPPASLRYFRARFRPLLRPRFWISLIVLSLIGSFGWAAWQHPEWLVQIEDEESPTLKGPSVPADLSDEDSAIAADIDSLPVLLQQMESNQGNSSREAQTTRTENFFDEFLKKQAAEEPQKSTPSQSQTAPTPQNANNPFAPQTPQTFSPGSLNNSGRSFLENRVSTEPSALNETNLLSPTPRNSSPAPANVLQEALDRSLGAKSGTATSDPTQISTEREKPSNAAGVKQRDPYELLRQTAPTTGLPGQMPGATNPYPGTPGYAVPGQVPGATSPYPGTTNYSTMPGQVPGSTAPYPGTPGYGVPPATTTNPGTPYNTFNYYQSPAVPAVPPVQSVTPSLTPVTPSPFGQSPFQNAAPGSNVAYPGMNSVTPGLQPSQLPQPQPFSVPRSIPGRPIGGGQINTFSNP